MDKELVAQIAASFQPGSSVHINTLDQENEVVQRARAIETAFTGSVLALKTSFPNERIRVLGEAIWDVFHHQHVHLALGPPVPGLTFAAFGPQSNLQGVLLAPHNWLEMIKEDPLMQLGAIIMTGSQAVDFYNGRIPDDADNLGKRGMAYEAEYLRTIGLDNPNEYQKNVLREFPVFSPIYEYPRKPVLPKGGMKREWS